MRRATNDETLTNIACNVNESSVDEVSSVWRLEGRRLVSLLQRPLKRTVITAMATNATMEQQAINSRINGTRSVKMRRQSCDLPITHVRDSSLLVHDTPLSHITISTSNHYSSSNIQNLSRRVSLDEKRSPEIVEETTGPPRPRAMLVSNDLTGQHSRIVSVSPTNMQNTRINISQNNVASLLHSHSKSNNGDAVFSSKQSGTENRIVSSLQSQYLEVSRDKSGHHLIILPKTVSHNTNAINRFQVENHPKKSTTTTEITETKRISSLSDQSLQPGNNGRVMTRGSCNSNRLTWTSSHTPSYHCSTVTPQGPSSPGKSAHTRHFPETFLEVQVARRGSLDNQRLKEERKGQLNKEFLPLTHQTIPVTQTKSK